MVKLKHKIGHFGSPEELLMLKERTGEKSWKSLVWRTDQLRPLLNTECSPAELFFKWKLSTKMSELICVVVEEGKWPKC